MIELRRLASSRVRVGSVSLAVSLSGLVFGALVVAAPVAEIPAGPAQSGRFPPLVRHPESGVPRAQTEPFLLCQFLELSFAFDSAVLQRPARSVLDRCIGAISEHTGAGGYVTVVGMADGVGGGDQNLMLSLQRSYAVVDFLVERGVQRDRVVASGTGEEGARNEVADPARRGVTVRLTPPL